MHYGDTWMNLLYFLSSQETGFEMSLLEHYDAELLMRQISYKQETDMYNICKG